MLNITITTSVTSRTYVLDLPITDDITLHYDQCDYCDKVPVRRESVHVNNRQEHRFCGGAHRKAYCVKGLAHVMA